MKGNENKNQNKQNEKKNKSIVDEGKKITRIELFTRFQILMETRKKNGDDNTNAFAYKQKNCCPQTKWKNVEFVNVSIIRNQSLKTNFPSNFAVKIFGMCRLYLMGMQHGILVLWNVTGAIPSHLQPLPKYTHMSHTTTTKYIYASHWKFKVTSDFKS